MTELFGLLDSLEATILEGKKIPLTEKVILEERKLLALIEKMRLALKSNGKIIRKSVDQTREKEEFTEQKPYKENSSEFSESVLNDARLTAEKIKTGAGEYADNVLANLLLLVTKMQKNLLSMETSIENGRQILDKVKGKSQPKLSNEIETNK